jgi:hypothetical protein
MENKLSVLLTILVLIEGLKLITEYLYFKRMSVLSEENVNLNRLHLNLYSQSKNSEREMDAIYWRGYEACKKAETLKKESE